MDSAEQQQLDNKLVRAKNQSLVVFPTANCVIIYLWLIASFIASGHLSFGKLGNIRFAGILETIAAFCAIVPLVVTIQIFRLQKEKEALETTKNLDGEKLYLQKGLDALKELLEKNAELAPLKELIEQRGKNYNNLIKEKQKLLDRVTQEEQDPYKKYLRRSPSYMDVTAVSVLTLMQITAACDIWLGLGINTLHKKLGLAFDMQTIVDTIGLSVLLISLCIKTYNKVQDNKETTKKSTKGQILYSASVALPLLGFSLMFLGKVFLGLESAKIINIPINNGLGSFPLALVLRVVGACISTFCLISFDLMGGLNKASLDDVSIAAASVAAISTAQ